MLTLTFFVVGFLLLVVTTQLLGIFILACFLYTKLHDLVDRLFPTDA